MKLLPRILILVALFWLAIVIFHEAHIASSKPDVDSSRIVLLFGAVVLVGGAAGVLLVVLVLPSVGDAIGNFFFAPNQAPEKSPHADALAAIARGDYTDAIEEFRNAYAADPTDTHALSEIARLYAEKLGEPEQAAEVLEQALQEIWPPEQTSFFRTRLADLRWHHQRDAERARELLLSIIGDYPGSPQAASATHHLHDLERHIAAIGESAD